MTKTRFCKYCFVAVKPIHRDPDSKQLGRGRLPAWVHVASVSEHDPIQCHRPNLLDEETTEENKWG